MTAGVVGDEQMGPAPGTCGGGTDADAGAGLSALQAKPTANRPPGRLARPAPYDPTGMRVYILPYQADPATQRLPLRRACVLATPVDAGGARQGPMT